MSSDNDCDEASASGHAAASESLAVIAQAIDDLASADLSSLSPAELTERVATIWALIGHIDPDLARRAAGYGPGGGTDRGKAAGSEPG